MISNWCLKSCKYFGQHYWWKRGTKHLKEVAQGILFQKHTLDTEFFAYSLNPSRLDCHFFLILDAYAPVGVDQIRNAFCQFDSLWHKFLSIMGNIMSILMVLNFTCFQFLSTLYLGVTNYDKYMGREMSVLIHLMVGGCWVQSC